MITKYFQNFSKTFQWYHAFISIFIIVLLMFADVIFLGNGKILSAQGTDTSGLFFYFRNFGYTQLKQGFLPFWNPHSFSGIPFLGDSNTAMIYPLNWVFFFLLPIDKAINLSIIFHIFILGFFMYLWINSRGLHPIASLFAAVLMMFSSVSFMHLYAGHLIDLSTMAWSPLMLLIVDKIIKKVSSEWIILGIVVAAMQILGGHPQYTYYTAITIVLYVLLNVLVFRAGIAALIMLPVIYLGSVCLCAIQILPVIDAANESVRSAGVSMEYAAMFSFPPENFITLISPSFFGDIKSIPYWGRCYLWAMTIYIGIVGAVLSVYGVFNGDKRSRIIASLMIIILIILALGYHTPLFNLMYHYFPFYNLFRGNSKFIFPATIFLIVLASIGLDEIIKQDKKHDKMVALLIVFGLVILGASIIIYSSMFHTALFNLWKSISNFISMTNESYLPHSLYQDINFINKTAEFASLSLVKPAIILLLLAIIFYLIRFSKKAVYLICLLGVMEVFIFASDLRVTFDMKSLVSSELKNFLQQHSGDYRILNLDQSNNSIALGAYDIWGYDPLLSLRYAQFISFTQSGEIEKPTPYVIFERYHKFFKMLRLRYIISQERQTYKILEYNDYLSHLEMISSYKVLSGSKAIFAEMNKDSFNPHFEIILEKKPLFESLMEKEVGNCGIINSSATSIIIKAKALRPCMLLITDNYSNGWKASGTSNGKKVRFDIIPANYTLMAIPLTVGEHEIEMKYIPPHFYLGFGISILSLLSLIIWLVLIYLKKCRNKNGKT